MTSIFVAKLDYGVSQDELRSAFERFGKVNKVTIATDRETGKPRGFAFVEMFSEDEALQAIEQLDGFRFNGRPVAVKKADDRSSGKPQGEVKREYSSPRPAGNQGEFKPDYKKQDDDSSPRASVPAPPVFDNFITDNKKKDKKKTKDKPKDLSDGRPKAQKMQAYKKSGKNRFIDFDDDDDF